MSWHNGRLWVGSVDENGSTAYVHRLNPTNGSTTLMLTIPLNYTRQNWFGSMGTSIPATWRSCSSDPTTVNYTTVSNSTETGYAQLMLTDIEFTGDDMILGFWDRWGDQPTADRRFRAADSQNTWGDAAGDILYACSGTTGYTLETETSGACGNPTASNGLTPSGPGGYEHYFGDIWENSTTWNPATNEGAFHWETTQGALLHYSVPPGRKRPSNGK